MKIEELKLAVWTFGVDLRVYLARRFGQPADWFDAKARGQIKILALAVVAALFAIGTLWAGFVGYETYAEYFSDAAQEARKVAAQNAAAQQEAIDEAKDEDEKDAAKQYWKEAQRARQVGQARLEADRYQWQTWKRTLQDIKDNNARLAEKQRIAEEEAAEAERQARLEKERIAQAAARAAAERTVRARRQQQSQVRMKKALRNF